jgi:hypothetical protein
MHHILRVPGLTAFLVGDSRKLYAFASKAVEEEEDKVSVVEEDAPNFFD